MSTTYATNNITLSNGTSIALKTGDHGKLLTTLDIALYEYRIYLYVRNEFSFTATYYSHVKPSQIINGSGSIIATWDSNNRIIINNSTLLYWTLRQTTDNWYGDTTICWNGHGINSRDSGSYNCLDVFYNDGDPIGVLWGGERGTSTGYEGHTLQIKAISDYSFIDCRQII